MSQWVRLLFSAILLSCALTPAQAQILTCTAGSLPPVVHVEGITERAGDIVLNCSGGAAGATISGNLNIFLNVSVTNRVIGSTVTDGIFTVDNGSGPQPANVPGVLQGTNALVFNGLSFTLSPFGSAVLRIANLRVAANQAGVFPPNSVQAVLSFTAGSLVSLTSTKVQIADPTPGLYDNFSAKLICGPRGSLLPDNTGSFANLIATGTIFNSTRITEGFADSFSPRGVNQNQNADTGTRILVRYAGFPAGARLFVPDVIAGSDTVQPTAGGDFEVRASGGQYAPVAGGTLLLARVANANSNGGGGNPVYFPGAIGSGTVSFDSISELTFNNGAAYVAYEVMDANPSVEETAQFPTFLGLGPNSTGDQILTSETVSLATLSTVTAATQGDPIPRFQQLPVASDCSIIGDCGAFYYPKLSVDQASLKYAAQAGSNFQTAYARIINAGGGNLVWNVLVHYSTATGWLRIDPLFGTGNGAIRVDAIPGNLSAGTYSAIITVDAGLGGSIDIPVTLSITGTPVVQPPTVQSVVNAATLATGPVSPGSLATIFGTRFAGTNVMATFDQFAAQILFHNDTQLNVAVPAALGLKTSASLIVNVDGYASTAQTVTLAPFAPGIFPNGVLNQDYSVNGISHPAPQGSIIQIFATGLSGNGVITAKIAGQMINSPYYGGPAPGLIGVQQVNVVVPSGLFGPSVNVAVCGGPNADQVVCSPDTPVAIGQ